MGFGDWLSGKLSGAWNWAKDIGSKIGNAGKWVKDTANKIANIPVIGQALKGAYDMIPSSIKGAINTALDTADTVSRVIGSDKMADAVNSFIGGTKSMPIADQLKMGGMVS